jgi:hypothetical protein
MEELIVPLLACATILYASVWYLQSRRLNKNTDKKAMPKGKKEETVTDKDEEAPQYIDKKINTA